MRRAATAISCLSIPCGPFQSDGREPLSCWQAAKLATVRGFHPGTTTEAQARAALKPFTRYEERSDQQREGIVVRQVYYQFHNSPEWTNSLAYHLRFLPLRITLPWTLFTVHLDFVDAFFAEIHHI
jgi:hypothetical protein